jgi:hypothetical protein
MRSSLDFRTMGGILALLATFLLAVPGVKAVRAEDRRAPIASSDGPQCNPGGTEAQVVGAGSAVQELQARVAAQIAAQAQPGEGAPVVLNTRGYNYQAESDLDRIAGDLERLSLER